DDFDGSETASWNLGAVGFEKRQACLVERQIIRSGMEYLEPKEGQAEEKINK
ncbi:hypothetical protein RUM43_009566, partial [Polyplax serrata]